MDSDNIITTVFQLINDQADRLEKMLGAIERIGEKKFNQAVRKLL